MSDPNEHFEAMPVTVPLFVRLVIGFGLAVLGFLAFVLAAVWWMLQS